MFKGVLSYFFNKKNIKLIFFFEKTDEINEKNLTVRFLNSIIIKNYFEK